MAVPLIDRARLSEAAVHDLELAVNGHASLERVLEWGRAQAPVRRVAEIVTQDEFTHDVLVPLDPPLYLAYDVT